MGSTYVSPETMGNYVSRNSEIAYQNSNTERDFINYFKREAEKHGIDLTNTDNINTLNKILKPYIKIFLKRKKEEKAKNIAIEEQSESIKSLKVQLEIAHSRYLKNQRENSRIIQELKNEKEKALIESRRREEDILKELYKNQKIAEEKIRKREEDTRKYIQELKEHHEEENRRRD